MALQYIATTQRIEKATWDSDPIINIAGSESHAVRGTSIIKI